MKPTSLVFKDEETRKRFDLAVVQSGLFQKQILQGMIDEFLENSKHAAKVIARAATLHGGRGPAKK